jgi:hypothetical protein
VQAVDPCITPTATATATIDPGAGPGVPTTTTAATTTTIAGNIPATGGSPSVITLVGVVTMLVGVAIVVAAGTGRTRSRDASG